MSQTKKHCEPLVAAWLRPSTTEPCICCKQVAEKPRGEHLKNDVGCMLQAVASVRQGGQMSPLSPPHPPPPPHTHTHQLLSLATALAVLLAIIPSMFTLWITPWLLVDISRGMARFSTFVHMSTQVQRQW